MALSTNLLMGQSSEWALLKRHPDEDIYGVQIAAGFPDQFGRTCELIENEMEVDFVDVSLLPPLITKDVMLQCLAHLISAAEPWLSVGPGL